MTRQSVGIKQDADALSLQPCRGGHGWPWFLLGWLMAFALGADTGRAPKGCGMPGLPGSGALLL